MNCLRCHGLMVTIRLEDVGSSLLCVSGWQCLLCGEVTDSVINANRNVLHGPRGAVGVFGTACRWRKRGSLNSRGGARDAGSGSRNAGVTSSSGRGRGPSGRPRASLSGARADPPMC